MSWKSLSNDAINKAFREKKPKDIDEAKRILKDAYPFGQRAMHPYKIWLACVSTALKQRYGKTSSKEQMDINEGLFSE